MSKHIILQNNYKMLLIFVNKTMGIYLEMASEENIYHWAKFI